MVDLVKDNIKKVYFKYLAAAFGSAFISSVYGIVDLAAVGKYYGTTGTAAIALIAPFWNIIYSLSLLAGIGGAVIFSRLRGQKEAAAYQESNEYYTAAVITAALLCLAGWTALIFFDEQLLTLFGASAELMPLARAYIYPVKFAVPCFIASQLMAAFLRNDGDPGLATKAVLIGGVFNVFGDIFAVFTLNMGITGAGIATCAGSFVSCVIMLSHFRSDRCTLVFTRPSRLLYKISRIAVMGFATFFVDVAMGILTILFNRQIMQYLDVSALAVYGIISYISNFVQCCAYSVGQASQPLLSVNYGAGLISRVRQTLKYALWSVAVIGLAWTGLCLAVPNMFVRLLTVPTPDLLSIAPSIIRCYALSFLLLPFNIFATYYFQALLKPQTALFISIMRGAVISGGLIYLLPALFGAGTLWYAMPVTELAVAGYAAFRIIRLNRQTQKLPAAA